MKQCVLSDIAICSLLSCFCPHFLSIMICLCEISMRYYSTRGFLSFHHSCYIFKSFAFTPVLFSALLSILRLPVPIGIAGAELLPVNPLRQSNFPALTSSSRAKNFLTLYLLPVAVTSFYYRRQVNAPNL